MTTTSPPKPRGVRTFLAGAWRVLSLSAVAVVAVPSLLAAQTPPGNPWEQAVNALMTAMTGPIARGLSLVAIVIGGLMFAFGEGGSKRTLAGIIFGLGMAMGAVNFLGWLF